MTRHARGRRRAILGDELLRRGRTYAIDKDCGSVSLGILRVSRRPDLAVNERGSFASI